MKVISCLLAVTKVHSRYSVNNMKSLLESQSSNTLSNHKKKIRPKFEKLGKECNFLSASSYKSKRQRSRLKVSPIYDFVRWGVPDREDTYPEPPV